MKTADKHVHTTNYFDTLIEVSEDSKAEAGTVPQPRNGVPTIGSRQHELIAKHPYKYTSDDVLFGVHADRNDIPEPDRATERLHFFSKGIPCFRASPLPKQFGWGVHFDDKGRMALIGRESDRYEQLLSDPSVRKVKAMRSSRA